MEDRAWQHVVDLYREIWKAYADIAALKMMLKAVEISGTLKPGWEARLEATRQPDLYKSYLAKGEAVILRAQQDRSETALIEWLTALPPAEFPN